MNAATLPLNAEKASVAFPRRSMLLAFAVAILATAAGGLTYFFLPLPPVPMTGRVVYLVKEKPDYILNRDVWNDRDAESFRKLQMATIASPWVLNEALNQPGVADLPMFALDQSVDPLDYLRSHLKIDFSLGTEYMRASLEGNNAEELLTILKAVDRAYNKFVVLEEGKRRRMRLETLSRLQSQYSDKIKAINMQIGSLQKADPRETLESLQLEKKNAEAVAAQVNDELMKVLPEMDAPTRVMQWEGASVSPGLEDNRRIKYSAMAAAGVIAAAGLLWFIWMIMRWFSWPAMPATSLASQ